VALSSLVLCSGVVGGCFLFFFVCVVVAVVLHTNWGVWGGFLFVFGLFSVVFLGVHRVLVAHTIRRFHVEQCAGRWWGMCQFVLFMVGVWCNWCGALTSNRSVRISMVENVSIKLMLIGIQFTIFGSILLMMNWQPASAYVLILFLGFAFSFVGLFYESLGNSSRNKLLHNSFLLLDPSKKKLQNSTPTNSPAKP
jgi:hypothetical protein